MHRGLICLFVALAAVSVGCSASRPDEFELAKHRAMYWRPDASRAEASPERITSLRDRCELVAARDLALDLAKQQPNDASALILASRAESDFLFVTAGDEQYADARATAAWSALDFAERAVAAGDEGAATVAQLAWAQGSVTHLMPMFARAAHARTIGESVARALAIDDRQSTAWATRAVLQTRLVTLPWIADVFAFGAPDASVKRAIDAAAWAVELRPSLQHALLLANAYGAAEREGDARAAVVAALEDERRFARDDALLDQARQRTAPTTEADDRTSP